MKKYLKYIAIILVITAIAGAVYYFFFREREALPEFIGGLFPGSEKIDREIAEPEEAEEPQLQALEDFPIFDYWINVETGDFYYVTLAGQVVKETEAGERSTVNSQIITRLNRVTASPNGRYALAKFNYPNLPTFGIFNTATDSWQPLPENTIAAAWSPDSQRLIYANENSLNILNLSNGRSSKALDLTQKALELDWVSDELVFLSVPASVEHASSIWSLNLSNNRLTPLFEDEIGLTAKWFENSDLGLALFSVNRSPFISLVDHAGEVLNVFNFTTLPSKCLIYLGSKLYCAVPKNIGLNTELPDDYYKKSVYFDDALYEIDLTGAGVFELTTENKNVAIDAEHLEVYAGRLYFKNRIDNRFYSFNLE